jgi:hypothetical protein
MPVTLGSLTAGVPRSLSNALYLTYAPKTPFISKLRKGESIDQIKHTYKVGREGAPITNSTPDNAPPAPQGGKNPEYEIDARVGFFEGTPRVGKFAKFKKIAGQTADLSAGKNAGKGTAHLSIARAQHLQRIKYGQEQRALSDNDSVAETATEADKFRGAGVWFQTTAQTDLPVPAEVRTPTGQIYTGTKADFTEAQLNTNLQNRWTSTGVSAELVGIVGAALKTQIGTFNRRLPTIANFESTIRYNGGSGKTIMQGVDIFEGDFGTVEFIADFFMPAAGRGYIFDMEQAEMLPYGPGVAEEPLGADGGGDALVLHAMFTWHPGDPRAHIKVKPSDE